MFEFFKKKPKKIEKKYTEEEQKEAISKIVKLLNDFNLTILTEQVIKIVPLEIEEAKDEGK